MIQINLKTIPHKEHRYETVGDYWLDLETHTWEVRVSNMNNWKYEFLVAIHELIEYALTLDRRIPEDLITSFDISFQGEGEPGDSPDAPYHKEHVYATAVEKSLAEQLGVDWEAYEKVIESLNPLSL